MRGAVIKKRYKDSERARVVRSYQESGLSVSAFCKREGVSKSNLYKWRQGLFDGPASVCRAASNFVELNLANEVQSQALSQSPDSSAPESVWSIELELKSGAILRFK